MSYVRYQSYAHVDKARQYNTKHRTRMLNDCSDLIGLKQHLITLHNVMSFFRYQLYAHAAKPCSTIQNIVQEC